MHVWITQHPIFPHQVFMSHLFPAQLFNSCEFDTPFTDSQEPWKEISIWGFSTLGHYNVSNELISTCESLNVHLDEMMLYLVSLQSSLTSDRQGLFEQKAYKLEIISSSNASKHFGVASRNSTMGRQYNIIQQK